MPKIYKRKIAENDLVDCYIYLAENVSLAMADQFLKNADALNPLMGSPLILQNPMFSGMRK